MTPEASVLKAVTDYLTAERIPWFRQNSGMHLASYNGKTRAIRYGMKGMADLLAVPMMGGVIPREHGSDECFCGDYRSQHDGDGCRVCKHMSDPAGGCKQFRFAMKARDAATIEHWNMYHGEPETRLYLEKRRTPLWLEIKRPGGRQSPAQKEFQQYVEANGMQYLVVSDVQQLIDYLKGER